MRDIDFKDDEYVIRRVVGFDVYEKEGKFLVRGGDNYVWRYDRFFEVDIDVYLFFRKRR